MIAKLLVGVLNREGCGPGPRSVEAALAHACQGEFKFLLQLLEWRILAVA